MIKLDTFNRLRVKAANKDTEELLLNLLAHTSKAAALAIDYLDSLDKISSIYFKEDSIGVYGIIDNIYFYKDFRDG